MEEGMTRTEWDKKWREKIITLLDAKTINAITSEEYREILETIPDEAIGIAFQSGIHAFYTGEGSLVETMKERLMKWTIYELTNFIESIEDQARTMKLAMQALEAKLAKEFSDEELKAITKEKGHHWAVVITAFKELKRRQIARRLREKLQELDLLPS